MHLFNLTLQPSNSVSCAIYGNFSSAKAHEIVVSNGKCLELLRPDPNGKMQSILRTEAFGVIRSLHPFRLTGGTRDYIVIGAASGRIMIVQHNPSTNSFDKIHQDAKPNFLLPIDSRN